MRRRITTVLLFTLTSFCALADQKAEIQQQIDSIAPKQLSAVLVQQDGKLLFESYYNGTSQDDLHNIRSASKTLTSLMFGIAIGRGLFDSVDDRVLPVFDDYSPQYNHTVKQNMRFFDLLSMTNPLECDDWNSFSVGNEERMYMRRDWVEFFLDLPLRGHAPWELPPEQQPYGRDFAYCTAGVSITAAAIETKAKQGLDKFAHDTLFSYLGIDKVIWPQSPTGIVQGGGGLEIRPLDLLKIGQLMLNKGKWESRQLVPSKWIKQSWTAYSQALEDRQVDYGLLWWIFSFEINGKTITTYAAAGNGGNYLFVAPELNLTAVITSTAYNKPYMHQQSQQIFEQAILSNLAE